VPERDECVTIVIRVMIKFNKGVVIRLIVVNLLNIILGYLSVMDKTK
jgi:hypothetical protein